MSEELVKRLRAGICGDPCRAMVATSGCDCAAAADVIERLTRERDEASALTFGVKGEISTTGALEEAAMFQRSWHAEHARATAAEARVKALEEKARAVVWFDWADNDADAVASIAALRAALEAKP